MPRRMGSWGQQHWPLGKQLGKGLLFLLPLEASDPQMLECCMLGVGAKRLAVQRLIKC